MVPGTFPAIRIGGGRAPLVTTPDAVLCLAGGRFGPVLRRDAAAGRNRKEAGHEPDSGRVAARHGRRRRVSGGSSLATPDALKGIAAMLAGSALLMVTDATMKFLSQTVPIGEVLALRGALLVAPLALLVLWRNGTAPFRVHSARAQALRAALFVGSVVTFLFSLTLLPLADAVCLFYAGPLFATVFAVLLLGERVGWRRTLAVAIGFGGVLIMLRPGAKAFEWPLLLPLASAIGLGFLDVVTRHISHRDPPFATFVYGSLAMTAWGAATLPVAFVVPDAAELGLIVVNAVTAGGGLFLTIAAFRHAGAAVVSPFRYSAIVWSVPLGYAVWGDLPDAWTILGAGLVVAGGIYIWYRERLSRS